MCNESCIEWKQNAVAQLENAATSVYADAVDDFRVLPFCSNYDTAIFTLHNYKTIQLPNALDFKHCIDNTAPTYADSSSTKFLFTASVCLHSQRLCLCTTIYFVRRWVTGYDSGHSVLCVRVPQSVSLSCPQQRTQRATVSLSLLTLTRGNISRQHNPL